MRELSHLMERVALLSPEAILTADTLEWLYLPRPQPLVPAEAEPGVTPLHRWMSAGASPGPCVRPGGTWYGPHACWDCAAVPCVVACADMA